LEGAVPPAVFRTRKKNIAEKAEKAESAESAEKAEKAEKAEPAEKAEKAEQIIYTFEHLKRRLVIIW
jgi:hypothetical protein